MHVRLTPNQIARGQSWVTSNLFFFFFSLNSTLNKLLLSKTTSGEILVGIDWWNDWCKERFRLIRLRLKPTFKSPIQWDVYRNVRGNYLGFNLKPLVRILFQPLCSVDASSAVQYPSTYLRLLKISASRNINYHLYQGNTLLLAITKILFTSTAEIIDRLYFREKLNQKTYHAVTWRLGDYWEINATLTSDQHTR